VPLGERRERVEPCEIVLAARRLVGIPSEAAAPRRDPELVEQREILFHVRQRVVFIVVLENAEGEAPAPVFPGRQARGEPAEEQREDGESDCPELPAPHVESTCELRATPRCGGQIPNR